MSPQNNDPLDTGGIDFYNRLVEQSTKQEVVTEVTATTPGKRMFEALGDSSFVRLAARYTNNPSVLFVSNGQRFWTADAKTFEQIFVAGVQSGDRDSETTRTDWHPVVGDERGLRIA